MLSLGKSLDRTLMQWDALQAYFQSEIEDKDETKDEEKVSREMCLIRKFKDPFSKDVKRGHEHSSDYQDKTGIRNNLC